MQFLYYERKDEKIHTIVWSLIKWRSVLRLVLEGIDDWYPVLFVEVLNLSGVVRGSHETDVWGEVIVEEATRASVGLDDDADVEGVVIEILVAHYRQNQVKTCENIALYRLRFLNLKKEWLHSMLELRCQGSHKLWDRAYKKTPRYQRWSICNLLGTSYREWPCKQSKPKYKVNS